MATETAQTSLFMAPMAKKKMVSSKYSPNSYRVISQTAESIDFPRMLTTGTTTTDFNILGQSGQPRPSRDHRYHRPNPQNVGFLRQDVRLLNEPVCNVETTLTRQEQNSWWPHRTTEEPLHKAEHTLDTTVREDFQYRGSSLRGTARHTANPNHQAVHGAVPVNSLRDPSGNQRLWKEGISYEHQYNSRADPSYPIRAKRHGSFVWDRVPQEEVDRFMETYKKENAYVPVKCGEQAEKGANNDKLCLRTGNPEATKSTATQAILTPVSG